MRLLLLIILTNIAIVYGQDIQFSQHYSAPLMQNPAFCGMNICNRFSLTHRIQWSGINPGYTTFLASYDHSFSKNNMSVGIMAGKDVAGSGDLKKLYFTPVIANEIRLTRETSIHAGISIGLGQVSINYSNLIFGDQIARGGNVETVESLPTSKVFLDLNSGVTLMSKSYWVAIAVGHINKPNEALIGSAPIINPMKFQIQGGYKIYLEDGDVKNDIEKSFTLATKFKLQNEFKQLDFGAYYTYNKISLGLWYRSLPFVSNNNGGNTYNDALIFILGAQLEKFKIGYSYDVTMSKLTLGSYGSHEISLAILFCNKNRRRPKPVLISCPKF